MFYIVWSHTTYVRMCKVTQWWGGSMDCFNDKQGGWSFGLDIVSETSYEPPHDKTNKMICAPSDDSDQPGHPPSLIRVFAVRMKKAWVFSYQMSAMRRLWSDWVDAQADLSLRWVHRSFCWFCHEAADIFVDDSIQFIITLGLQHDM